MFNARTCIGSGEEAGARALHHRPAEAKEEESKSPGRETTYTRGAGDTLMCHGAGRAELPFPAADVLPRVSIYRYIYSI